MLGVLEQPCGISAFFNAPPTCRRPSKHGMACRVVESLSSRSFRKTYQRRQEDLIDAVQSACRPKARTISGEVQVGWEFHYRRVYLRTWPDFIGMPAEQLPVVASICALVNRKPTVASLIPLILDLPKGEVFAALEYLRMRAHINMPAYDAVQLGSTSRPVTDDTLPDLAKLPPDDMPLAPTSLITRLWSRLSVTSRR